MHQRQGRHSIGVRRWGSLKHHRFVSLLLAVMALSLARQAWAAQTTAYVITTDFMTGGVSTVNLDNRSVSQDVASVHSDAVCRWYQGRLYVVNRFGGDNIQVLDPSQGFTTVLQFSTGNGSNPQDIAFVSTTKAYVSRLGNPGLLVVNPSTGASLRPPISLAAFADGDGNPEAYRMVRVGRWLFVALQRLTGFTATDTSWVVVIDTEADTVLDVKPDVAGTQAIRLVGTNPATVFEYDVEGRRILVGCSGRFGVMDGGIEAIDPFTFESLGFVITEAGLGGDVIDLAWNGPAKSYAIVSDASFNTSLVKWSETSSSALGTLYSPGGFSLPRCAINDRGELYVANNNFFAPGLLVFSTATDLAIAGPLDTGLPPFDLCFDAPSNPLVGVPERPYSLSLMGPWPNPTRSSIRLRIELERFGSVRVEVYDLEGRRRSILAQGEREAGVYELAWDLKDQDGFRLAAGLYYVMAQVNLDRRVQRMVVLP